MHIRGVDFVSICVPGDRMEEAKAFYGQVLGLPAEGITNDSWAEYRAGALTIALDSAPFLPPPTDTPPGGEVRIALAVDDLAGTLSDLSRNGIAPVVGLEDCGPCLQAAIRDPFGSLIFLHQRKDGSAG